MEIVKGEELLKETIIENTPFSVIEHEEKFYVSVGKIRRISNAFDTFEDAESEAKTVSWNKIMQIINLISTKL